jgi:D-alanyl-D-alanine carboxypeptidase/D-alanyl-D-alanine-endopeptidase (penicillin-binding protein 4)
MTFRLRFLRAAAISLVLAFSAAAMAAPPRHDDTPKEAPWAGESRALADEAARAAAGTTGDEAVRRVMKHLVQAAQRENLELAYAVTPLDSGRTIAGHQMTVDQDPASNTKLATAAYALHVLGPDHRFETEFHTDKAGNLYVRGGFDPTLDPAALQRAAKALKDSGVRHISGNVVLDGSRLADADPTPVGFSRKQRWAYQTPPAALAVEKDLYTIDLKPGAKPGDPATFQTGLRTYKIHNEAVTGPVGQKSHLGIEVIPAGVAGKEPVVKLTGTINPEDWGRKLVMRSPDPLLSFRNRFSQALRAEGIEVDGHIEKGVTPAGTTIVHRHLSAPLAEIMNSSLGGSNEFDHEMFSVAVASYLKGGAPIHVADGVEGVRNFLEHDVKVKSFVLRNASGIGGVNRLSNRDITKIVRWAAAGPRTAPLLDAMASPGEGGTTVSTRMTGTEAVDELRVKTGTNERHIMLGGVALQNEKDPHAGSTDVAFSVRVTGDPALRPRARMVADSTGIALSLVEASPRKPTAPRPRRPPPVPQQHR